MRSCHRPGPAGNFSSALRRGSGRPGPSRLGQRGCRCRFLRRAPLGPFTAGLPSLPVPRRGVPFCSAGTTPSGRAEGQGGRHDPLPPPPGLVATGGPRRSSRPCAEGGGVGAGGEPRRFLLVNRCQAPVLCVVLASGLQAAVLAFICAAINWRVA